LDEIVIGWFSSKNVSGPSIKMAPTAELSLTEDPMGNSHKNLVWNQLLNWNQTLIGNGFRQEDFYGNFP
jgi:hypothetical protein